MHYFSPDDPVIDHGTTGRGPAPSGDQESRFAWLERMRRLLLLVVGGDERRLELLLDLHDGRITHRQYAKARRVHPSTAVREIRRLRERLRRTLAADLAHSCLWQRTGFTIDVRWCKLVPVGTADGYAVAIADSTRTFPHPPTRAAIETYLARRARYFRERKAAKHYFGGWVHDGFHLEVAVILPEIEGAIAFAAAHGQRTIYDLRQGREIDVAREECRAA